MHGTRCAVGNQFGCASAAAKDPASQLGGRRYWVRLVDVRRSIAAIHCERIEDPALVGGLVCARISQSRRAVRRKKHHGNPGTGGFHNAG